MSYLNLRDTNNSTPTAIEILKRSSVFFLDLNGTVGDSNNTNAENVVTSEMAQSLARLLEIKTIVLNSGWDLKGIQARILDKLRTIDSINWSNLYIMPSNGSQLLKFNINGELPKIKEFYRYSFDVSQYNQISELVFGCIRTFLNNDLQKYFPQENISKLRDCVLQNMDGELREGGTQASFFPIGKKANNEEKMYFFHNTDIRPFIIEALNKHFQERGIGANAQSGGKATIDINIKIPESGKTVTKAHGIERFLDITGTNPNMCVFMGDDLHDNGSNDYPVLELKHLGAMINVVDQNQTQELFNHLFDVYTSRINTILNDDEHIITPLSSEDNQKYCIQLLDQAGVIFSDLDETLVPSKTTISPYMVEEISRLLTRKKIVVITGGLFQTIKKNLLDSFSPETHFSNLVLLPILGNEIWLYNSISGEYELVSEKKEAIIDAEDIEILNDAIKKAINNFGQPDHLFGDMIEKRGTSSVLSLSVSYFGQTVPKEYDHLKKTWDPSRSKRAELIKGIKSNIPPYMCEKYDFQIGGSTSIDIVKRGFDKSTGIEHYLSSAISPMIDRKDMVAIGDSCDTSGNDYPMSKVIPNLIHVLSPDDTYRLFLNV